MTAATKERSADLFAALRDPSVDDATTAGVRDELVALHLPLVHYCARGFRDRGEPYDDLVQVGTIGLIKAIDRFEPDRGFEFSTYATPTIVGEIKRHFRDKGWSIRVPRRLQEIRMAIGAQTPALTQSLGRSPTPRELADAVGCTVEDILETLESAAAYAPMSLDAGSSGDPDAPALADTLGEADADLEQVELRESVRAMLDQLPARERTIVVLRFYKNMTQSQIAAEIGVSQMHVSRLLARTLDQLRSRTDLVPGS